MNILFGNCPVDHFSCASTVFTPCRKAGTDGTATTQTVRNIFQFFSLYFLLSAFPISNAFAIQMLLTIRPIGGKVIGIF
jgi:hypothetical protein